MYCHADKYYWSDPEDLDWHSHRGPRIQSTLKTIHADIVCLQEVQTDIWDDFMIGLEDQYVGILQNMTNDHPVANAVLLRKDGRFRVKEQESRSRALILVLEDFSSDDGDTPYDDDYINEEPQPPPKRLLYLANVHLQAGLDDDETRVNQLKSLLKRLVFHMEDDDSNVKAQGSKRKRMKQKAKDLFQKVSSKADAGKSKLLWKTLSQEEKDAILQKSKRKAAAKQAAQPKPQTRPPAPVIIAGDMNMLPTNPVYRWLSHRDHLDATADHTQQQQDALADAAPKVNMRDAGTGLFLQFQFPTRGKHVDLLPLTDVYRQLPPVLCQLEPQQLQQQVDDHDDDNDKEKKQEEEADMAGKPIGMTYCGGSVLDYIWTTTAPTTTKHTNHENKVMEITKTMVFHPLAFQKDRQPWPSKDFPSDHLPIGVEFSWYNTSTS